VSGPVRSLIPLLGAARRDRAELALSDFSVEQVRWAVASGLGPWLRRCIEDDPGARTSPLWPLVLSADLTARVMVAEQLDATEEILAAAPGHVPPLTLLKGIALCEHRYPEPHLRTMGDIDLLVDGEAASALWSRLIELGYRPRSSWPPEFYETHHHLMPLFHPRRRVWVEVHRGLFPPGSRVGSDEVFGWERIAAERQPSLFRGHRVFRLSDELELVYLASHWAFGFRRERGMVGMLDVIRLLESTRLRWERVLPWLEDSLASAYVCLLLTYLHRRRLTDLSPGIVESLWHRQRLFGRANLGALHAVIDRHVVGGRPFDRVVSARTFRILWEALLSPGGPSQNLLRLAWSLLPSRNWLRRAVTGRA
jgi:Uncharacterised nucleotidyltransferase